MKSDNAIWNGTSIFVGIIVAIAAFVRGALLLPLLLVACSIWELYVLHHLRSSLPAVPKKKAKAPRRTKFVVPDIEDEPLSDILLLHVNQRVTAALRTADSNITWEWATKAPHAIVKEGGRCLIRVHGLDGFESAEVVLDKQAHLRCELINTVPLRPNPTADTPENPRIPAETPPLPAPRIWCETEGRATLEGIVADLSSRGHHSMTVQEDGHIQLTDGSTSVLPELHGFPPVGCWEKVKQVFAGDGLAAEETSGKLVLSW